MDINEFGNVYGLDFMLFFNIIKYLKFNTKGR